MIRSAPRSIRRRLYYAAAFSAALHLIVLWLPGFELPEREVKLAPLVAKLEPLPKATAKISRPKPKAKPQPKPEPTIQSIPELPIIASAPVAASAPSVAEPEPTPVVAETPVEPTVATEPQRPRLPKQARLKFNVYQGQGGFKIGESIHTLKIEDNYYSLKASVETTGLVSVVKSYRLVQTSYGEATPYTLKPDIFTEEITDSSGKKSTRIEFDWANRKLHFSNGTEADLLANTQDILSILYQFPPMPKRLEVVSIAIITSKKFEQYRFEIMFEEELDTPMGKLQTVHFRKLRNPDQVGLEIWFAQEYRLLPVKVRYIEPSGKISGEALITEIGVSDE